MGNFELKKDSVYAGCCMILTTKHAKSLAVAPPFWNKLGVSVVEYALDTDKLGTFSGEIKRNGTALECARRKCEWSLERLGDKAEFFLASEGSFGLHPSIPFIPCDHEILYFIDRRHDFHLHLSYLSENTNYRMAVVNSLEELLEFASSTQFPSHALILRPTDRTITSEIFKGLDSSSDLEAAFAEAKKQSIDGKVYVETDMRAQYNPSRMSVISELAEKLAERLLLNCPHCKMPGWGVVAEEIGLPCSECGAPTSMIKNKIFGCVKCDYKETQVRSDKKISADPTYCQYCNP